MQMGIRDLRDNSDMKTIIDLSDKNILVIGASSGIGRQTAITLSQIGAKVILVARNEERLQSVICELEGAGHHYYPCDVSKVETIENLIKTIVAEAGPLDGLVYTAGMEAPVPLTQAKPDRVQEVFDINYFAFLETVRQATKKGRFNAGMRIVGISSVASVRGEKSRVIYSSSKGAMDAAIRCLAVELALKEICINSIEPSMIDTEMYLRFAERLGEGSVTYKANRQFLGMGQPQDVANAVAFLLSPASRFITGISLPVDGGFTSC